MTKLRNKNTLLYCIAILILICIVYVITLKNNIVFAEANTALSKELIRSMKDSIKNYIKSDNFVIPLDYVKDLRGIKISNILREKISDDFITHMIQTKQLATDIKDYTKLQLSFDIYIRKVCILQIISLKETIPVEHLIPFEKYLRLSLMNMIADKQFFSHYFMNKETRLFEVLHWFVSFIWSYKLEMKLHLVDSFFKEISIYQMIAMCYPVKFELFVSLFFEYILGENELLLSKITLVLITVITSFSLIQYPFLIELFSNLNAIAEYALVECALIHPEATENIGIVTPGYDEITQRVVQIRDFSENALNESKINVVILTGVTIIGLYLLKNLFWP